jgi:multidrug efflux pump subunit AcrB
VTGVLVDDAIVEIENIVRHMRQGKPPYKAAMEAADEIGLAVVATSATIIAVFLPVSFMTGVTGQFFKEFGITVAIAVFISLLVARLITPMMAAHFLRFHGESDHPGRLRRAYEKTLAWAIGNPWKAVAAGLTIWIVSLVMAFHLPVTFIPRIDNGAISLSVEFPPGTPLMEADKQLQALVRKTRGVKEIESYFTSISGTEGAVSSASVNYKLVPREKRDKSAYQVQQELRPLVSTTPDVRATFQNFQGGGRGADITVQLVSDDPTKVEGAADKLVSEMKALPELADVRSSASLKRPKSRSRRSRTKPRAWAFRRPRSPAPCASPPAATSIRTWPSSTFPIGRSRSACCCGPMRAPIWKRSARCACAPARATRSGSIPSRT